MDVEVPEDPVGAIRGFLRGVDKTGVELQHEARRIRAMEHMARFGLDLDDALVYQAMRKLGIAKIVSYDRDFDRVAE